MPLTETSQAPEKLTTFEEFEKMPDDPLRYELRHGHLECMAPPKSGHQRIQRRLQKLLEARLPEGEAVAELGFKAAEQYEYWYADVGYVAKARFDAVPADKYLQGAPDLMVEVLSPSNTADEIQDRMETCLAAGCQSFWVVNPKRRTVDVTEAGITRRFRLGDAVECRMLTAPLQVAEIFAEAPLHS